MMGEAEGLAISLGMHHAPVPHHPLLDAPALLVSEEYGRPAVPGSDAADQRRVIG